MRTARGTFGSVADPLTDTPAPQASCNLSAAAAFGRRIEFSEFSAAASSCATSNGVVRGCYIARDGSVRASSCELTLRDFRY